MQPFQYLHTVIERPTMTNTLLQTKSHERIGNDFPREGIGHFACINNLHVLCTNTIRDIIMVKLNYQCSREARGQSMCETCERPMPALCEERNGATEEVAAPTPYFGYAGNFVHRDGDIAKPLPASEHLATLLFQ